MYTEEQLRTGIKKAYDAGDIDAVNEMASALDTMLGVQEDGSPTDTPAVAAISPETVEEENNFWFDKVKRGFLDFIESTAPDALSDEVLGLDLKEYQLDNNTFDVRRYERDKQAAKDEAARQYLGYEGIKANSGFQRLAGEAVRGTVAEGPMAIVGASRMGAKGLAGAGKLAASTGSELLHSLTANFLGQAGGEAGYMLGEATDSPEWLKEAFAGVGGLVGGASTIPARAGLKAAGESGKQLWNERQRFVESADKAAEYTASAEMRRLTKDAQAAQPDLDKTIDLIVDLQKDVPGLVVPPAAALSNNPVYRENTEYLLKTDPNAYASIKNSLKQGLETVEKRREALFGPGGPETEARIRATVPTNYAKDIKNARKRIEEISTKLDKVSEAVRPQQDLVDVGKSVENLMNSKVQAVRDKLSPKYTKLLNDADRAGVMFPAESVSSMYNTYRELRSNDVFKQFPRIANAMKSKWGPKEVEQPQILNARGEPTGTQTRLEFEPVPIKEMDSLKREVNAALRTTKDAGQLRVLNEIKSKLREETQKLPGDFGQKYVDLDTQFYNELGIPKNKAEIAQLDSAKFRTQAGQYLAKPEQAAEFLSFVGEKGIPVVRDAVMLKMQNAIFNKDGLLDVKNLNKFMAQNQRLINTVPSLRQEMQNAGNVFRRLTETQARLDAEYTLKARELANGFYQNFMDKNLKGVAQEIIRSPGKSEKYLKDIKNFTPDTSKLVRQAVRSQMLEEAMNSNKSMEAYIKENKNVFNQWFGKTYSKDIESLAIANDLLKNIDVETMNFAINYRQEDALSKRLGFSMVQAQSVLRDRIAGATTKAAILGSKMNVAQAKAKRDSMLMDMLLNPESLAKIRALTENNKFKIKTPEVVGAIANTVNNAVWKGVYFGLEGAEDIQESEFMEE